MPQCLSEESALSAALQVLTAVTLQQHHRGAGILPHSSLLSRCSQRHWGWAQSCACVCCKAGGEDAESALQEMLRTRRFCSSSLPAFPEALQ